MLIGASFTIVYMEGLSPPLYVIFLFLCFVFVALVVVVVVIFLLSYQAVLWAHSHLITYVY